MYIVLTKDPNTGKKEAFETEWYEYENHYNPDYEMIVIDLSEHRVSFDGKHWDEIEEDHL